MRIKKFINGLVWSYPFVVLIIIVWLSFYQHPTMDDFAGDLLVKRDGLAQAIYLYLKNSNGRFFVVPIFLYFTSTNFFLENYFLLIIIFLVLALISSFYFIKSIFKNQLYEKNTVMTLSWFTSMFFVISLSVIPEPSSYIFWITTGIVYLIPFQVMLFYVLILTLPFRNGSQIRSRTIFLLILFSFLLVGSNEVSIFFSFSILLLSALYYFLIYRRVHVFYVIGFISQVVFIVCTFLLPGNLSRSAGFTVKQSWYNSIISGIYQALENFYSLVSNTYFWLGIVMVLIFAPRVKIKCYGNKKYANLFLHLCIIFLLNFFFCFFIRHFTGWVVPERSKNIMVLITMIYIYMFTYLSFSEVVQKLEFIYSKNEYNIKIVLLIILLFNPFTQKLIQTLLIASIHNDVLNDRINLIASAKEKGQKSVHFSPYKETFYNELTQKYSKKIADFVLVEFPIPPSLMYFKDEPFDQGLGFMYAEYYEIDSIITKNGIIFRNRNNQ